MPTIKNPSELVSQALSELQIPARPESLYAPVRYTMSLGGKRLRPQLVLIGCGLAGGNPEKALHASMSVELLHNFTLIHDDIMDKADSRRGKPTVHTKWDEATAILSGDVMFNMAFQQLEFYADPDSGSPELFAKLHRKFSEATRIICEGQAMDMDFETSLNVPLDRYIEMIACKTAALLEASLVMGGHVAGADDESIEKLATIGREAGIAFQIQDDLLDAVADPESFGKRVGGDIYEGKKTYLSILALERAGREERDKISGILQKKECTQQEVGYVIERYHDLGIIKDTREAIKNRYIACLSALGHFDDGPYKKAVSDLVDSLIHRES